MFRGLVGHFGSRAALRTSLGGMRFASFCFSLFCRRSSLPPRLSPLLLRFPVLCCAFFWWFLFCCSAASSSSPLCLCLLVLHGNVTAATLFSARSRACSLHVSAIATCTSVSLTHVCACYFPVSGKNVCVVRASLRLCVCVWMRVLVNASRLACVGFGFCRIF